MAKTSWGWRFGLVSALVMGNAAIAFNENRALAQIVPDATLGVEPSVITPNVNIGGSSADRIDGGALRGANLFHSFLEFNVGNGQRVYFANPVGIENILSRVTGNSISTILGTLGVDGGANLFLLNPNGIIFGQNAKLDIAGSFVATTANSLVFENGSKFSATNPEAPPLLTISLTPGLQYGSNQPRATIANAGNLTVGQNLTLDAGNLDLQGQLQAGRDLTLQAQDAIKVRDSAVNPFIASAGGQLLVQGNQKIDIFALNHPNSGFYSSGDMVLRSANTVGGDAHYWSGGNFRIEQLDSSLGNLESPNDPIVRASGDVNFASYRGASLHILAGGSVTITGGVTITDVEAPINSIAENVTLSDGTTLVVINGSTRPTLDIRAGTTAFGTPGITPPDAGVFTPGQPGTGGTGTSANITIGNININAPNGLGLVFLTNQYQPNTTLPGGNIQVTTIDTRSNRGNGGDVFIDSRGDLTLPSNGFINTSSSASNAGNITLIANGLISSTGGDIASTISSRVGAKGGDINIQAGSLSLTNGSEVRNSVSSGGQGNAGNMNINVRNSVTFAQTNYGGSPTLIESSVDSGAVGNGGNINIRAGSLLLEGTAGLQAQTDGRGNAGNIVVQVDDSVSLIDGGLIFNTLEPRGQGNAGTIQIYAPNSVTISGVNPSRSRPNGGYSSGLFTNTREGTSGQAGSITVSTGVLRVQNGAVVDASTANASDGGDIAINANRMELTGGGQILSVTRAGGKAGNVNLNIADTVTISGSDPSFESRLNQFGRNVVTNEDAASGIYTDVSLGSTGNGGNLSLNTRQLNVSDGGQVLSASFGTGNAGNLSITATDSVNVVNPNSRVVTSAFGSTGNSGNVSISTRQLNVSDKGVVSTNSVGTGSAGNLAIAASDSVIVSNEGLLSTGTNPSSAGNGGTISISTRQLDVKDGGQIDTASTGTGNSGNLAIAATDSMNVVNRSVVITSSDKGAGVAGRLDIQTGRLSIRDGSLVVSSTVGSGDAGDVTVRAVDSVEFVNSSKLSADTVGSGNAGNLTIETNTLSIRDSEVSTGTTRASSGRGGTLSVRASDAVEIGGLGGLVTGTEGSGRGGDLSVTTRRLTARDGGRVEAGTAGSDRGGDVTVNASELIELSGRSADRIAPSGVSAKSGAASTVGSGNVNLTSGELIIRDGAEVTTETLGAGKGGDVRVQGNSLSLSNSGSIASRSRGLGRAGDISVNLSDNLRSQGGIISATSTQTGGGNITVTARDIRLRNGSLLSSSVFDSTGGGGNITISSELFLALEDSDILANADAGPGGNITINSRAFLIDLFSRGQAAAVGRNPGNLSRFRGNARVDISDDFTGFVGNRLIDISDDFAGFLGNDQVDISADSLTGSPGIVNTPSNFSTQREAPLPSNMVDASELIDRRCTPDQDKRGSSFTVTGRGGLPPSPTDPLTGEAVITNWVTLDSEEENRDRTPTDANPTSSNPKQLVEAQGWVFAPDGRVILTAQAPTVTPQSPWLTSPSCHRTSEQGIGNGERGTGSRE